MGDLGQRFRVLLRRHKRPFGTIAIHDHPLKIRVSLPLRFGRYYVLLLAGKELRSAERRKEERQKHPLWTAANTIILFAAGFIVGGSTWIGLQNLTIWIFGRDGM